MSLDMLCELNNQLLNWNLSRKEQRFGQYLESNMKGLFLPLHYYNSNDSYEVYSHVVTMIEKGEL